MLEGPGSSGRSGRAAAVLWRRRNSPQCRFAQPAGIAFALDRLSNNAFRNQLFHDRWRAAAAERTDCLIVGDSQNSGRFRVENYVAYERKNVSHFHKPGRFRLWSLSVRRYFATERATWRIICCDFWKKMLEARVVNRTHNNANDRSAAADQSTYQGTLITVSRVAP